MAVVHGNNGSAGDGPAAARSAAPAPAPACAAAPPLPGAMLDTLAMRFRDGGLFLVALDRHGAVTYFDSGAPAFFTRYVLPVLRNPAGAVAGEFAAALREVT